ncbi:ApeA N-terminal domain 1-containing protein [Lonsdalea quercina]|uniref:ApeA N-terminal domain 1-containing protein n=1 Tax=Lonsdalea quercina TaxID=71657 RepID=UPI0039755CAB
MTTYENYNGIFLSTDSQFAGMLKIAGADSILKLVGKTFWECPETENFDIHGMLYDGKKVSLLDCVLNRKTQHRFDESSQFESVFFPNLVVVGEDYLRSDEPVIKAVHYHFENVNCFLSGHETFQSLHPDTDEIRQILDSEHKRGQKFAEKYGWTKHPFKPQIGEHPHLLYFSGLWEIIASESKLGKVSLTNRTFHRSGSAAGIGIKNEVTANIEFLEPKTVDIAVNALRSLHGLFELSLGHRQRFCWIELELTHRSKNTVHDIPQTVQLYWSLCNNRVGDESRTQLNDVLISPERHPEEFSRIVSGWMNSADAMGDPRERFGTAFYGSYSIDRIVGAANMFDLLPETHAPKMQEADDALKQAVGKCRETFLGLPESPSRQSILSALGRVGQASLRDKVYFRAKKVTEATEGKFPELKLPCNHAVLARNHYVHGSKGAFDYQKHFGEFAFIIDTLEFVFAASDLLDLGWDLKKWMDNGTSMTHPFGAYIVNYSHNIRKLKALLGK